MVEKCGKVQANTVQYLVQIDPVSQVKKIWRKSSSHRQTSMSRDWKLSVSNESLSLRDALLLPLGNVSSKGVQRVLDKCIILMR